VIVDHEGKDALGRDLAQAVREGLERSAVFRPSTPESAAQFAIVMDSISVDQHGKPTSADATAAAMSVVFSLIRQDGSKPGSVWGSLLIKTAIMMMGRDKVTWSAEEIIHLLENVTAPFRSRLCPVVSP